MAFEKPLNQQDLSGSRLPPKPDCAVEVLYKTIKTCELRFDSTLITEEENTEKITQNIINQIMSSDIDSTSITENENTEKITQNIINQITSSDIDSTPITAEKTTRIPS